MDQGYNLQRQGLNQMIRFLKADRLTGAGNQAIIEKNEKQMRRILNRLADKNIMLQDQALR